MLTLHSIQVDTIAHKIFNNWNLRAWLSAYFTRSLKFNEVLKKWKKTINLSDVAYLDDWRYVSWMPRVVFVAFGRRKRRELYSSTKWSKIGASPPLRRIKSTPALLLEWNRRLFSSSATKNEIGFWTAAELKLLLNRTAHHLQTLSLVWL